MLQTAFYRFCVRLKSVTEQHLDKMKKRQPRQPGQGPGTVYLCLSQSQNYTSQNSMLDQQGQAAGGRERRGNTKEAREEHVKWPGMIADYEA